MKVLDLLKLSTRIFKINRLRTFLTIAGIGVGVGAILFLVSLGYGVQKVILERIANSDAILSLDVITPDAGLLKLDDSLVSSLSAYPEVELVSPMVSFSAQAERNDYQGVVAIDFVKTPFFRLAGRNLASGRIFEANDLRGIVVTTAFLRLLDVKGNADPAIDPAKIRFSLIIPKEGTDDSGDVSLTALPGEYLVIGVIKDDNSPRAYANFDNLFANGVRYDQLSQLKVKAKDQKLMLPLREKIIASGYKVSAISEVVDQANKVFSVIQLVLAAFGVISLIVSAIGMFNTMTISLLQRTREIGIMKSIGAKNRDVNRIFLTESILIGFLGGLAGLGFGFGMQYLFSFLLSVLAKTFHGEVTNVFYTPLWFIITIMLFATLVGLLTGVWPAKRAAKLNPLEALRNK